MVSMLTSIMQCLPICLHLNQVASAANKKRILFFLYYCTFVYLGSALKTEKFRCGY